jgi:nucleoside-diphosphate-sugar epimerase
MASPGYPFKTVGLTGATGTVAAEFIGHLLEHAPELRCITASCRNTRNAKARHLATLDKVALIEGGILDLPVLRHIAASSDIVYHLAAWLANTVMPDSHEEIFTINCLSTAVIGRLCSQAGKRLVFTSSHSAYFAGPYQGTIAEDRYQFRSDFVDWIARIKPAYDDLAMRIISGQNRLEAALADIRNLHSDCPPPFDPLIYNKDEYHLYCLSKLLAESLVLDNGGIVLRLSNVYGPGDESTQAVGEACQRLLAAGPDERLNIRQPFKKLVPAYIGDINAGLFRAAALDLPSGMKPVFTMASQSSYLREDELLKTVDKGLMRIRGSSAHDIETLPPEDGAPAFAYDLSKLRTWLLPGHGFMPFVDGLEAQLRRLISCGFGSPNQPAAGPATASTRQT